MDWYRVNTDQVLQELKTTEQGLTSLEAQLRLQQSGENKIRGNKKRSMAQIFLSQFQDLMIIILLFAALVAGFIGDLVDTAVIITIILLNAFIGFYQEFKAESTMQALKKLVKTEAKVFRDSRLTEVKENLIVPGDILSIEAGNLVPADLRMLTVSQLKIDESALTGESIPSDKTTEAIDIPDLPPGDKKNIAYKGTFVTQGHGLAVVVATGMQTQLGNITKMLEVKKPLTPLQQSMSAFSKNLSVIIVILCILFFIAGWLRGEDTINMLLTSISLAVAAIPEALPTIILISLALAAKRMLRQHTLVRNLSAVETLGTVQYICTDKTGTLTKNQIEVAQIFVNKKLVSPDHLGGLTDQEPFNLLLHAFALNNDAVINQDQEGIGDSTETALLKVAGMYNIDQKKYPRLAEIPFDADRKLMTTFHTYQDKIISFTKGAPELLIRRCVQADIAGIEQTIEKMAAAGQRTMGFAYRYWETLPNGPLDQTQETGLTFIGLAGMTDPPREEIREAISACQTAGINIVMITGDHRLTAEAIGRNIGIINKESDKIVTGQQLFGMDDANLYSEIENIKVYARVSPEQKLRIIKMLRQKGYYIAMIGDGVNDAPALKSANIGVAMGITGADFSKEQADMVLLDDNFATIVKSVAEGRRIYDNILKFIKYLLTTNAGELWTLLLAPVIGLPVTLLPIHILWTNLVSDGLPALSLSNEKAEKDIMKRPPRSTNESVFGNGRGLHMLLAGILMAAVVLTLQGWAINNGYAWRTIAFNTLCLSQMGHVLAIRSDKQSLFTIGLFTNRPLIFSVLLVFSLQLAITYIPFLQPVFHTESLSFIEFIIVGCSASIVFFSIEIQKFLSNKLNKAYEKDTGNHRFFSKF